MAMNRALHLDFDPGEAAGTIREAMCEDAAGTGKIRRTPIRRELFQKTA